MNMLYFLFLITWLTNNQSNTDCKVEVNTNVITPICPSNENFEVFKIKTTCELAYSKTTIYNRWGNIVFEEANSNNGFEGKYEKKLLPDSTYFYLIKYQILDSSDTLQISGYLQIQI